MLVVYLGQFLEPLDKNSFRKTNRFYRDCFSQTGSFTAREAVDYAMGAVTSGRHDALCYFCLLLKDYVTDDSWYVYRLVKTMIEVDDVEAFLIFRKHFPLCVKQNIMILFDYSETIFMHCKYNGQFWKSIVLGLTGDIEILAAIFGTINIQEEEGIVDFHQKVNFVCQHVTLDFIKYVSEKKIGWDIIDTIMTRPSIRALLPDMDRTMVEKLQKIFISTFNEDYICEEWQNVVDCVKKTGFLDISICNFCKKHKLSHSDIEYWCNCGAAEPPSKKNKKG